MAGSVWFRLIGALILLLLLAACEGAAARRPLPQFRPHRARKIRRRSWSKPARRRKAALDLYRAGQVDASYEKATSAYLDGFEKLEAPLLLVSKDTVPALEDEFKALRDGIQARKPQAGWECRWGQPRCRLTAGGRSVEYTGARIALCRTGTNTARVEGDTGGCGNVHMARRRPA